MMDLLRHFKIDYKFLVITAMDCYYHPKQPLLNFCNNPNCSLPLCPKCIHIHLSQSITPHHIVPLNQALQSTAQLLQTASAGLANQLKSLRQQYDPKNVLKDYTNILQKYRRQAIDEINRHYDYLQRELLNQLGSRYSQHLQNLVVPIENELAIIEKNKVNIKKHQKSIQSLILVVSQQRIAIVQQLLKTSRERKALFKNQLPRLQDGEGGKLKMTAQRLQILSERVTVPSLPATVAAQPSLSPLAGLDRIAQLQARLMTLRYAE